MKTIIALLVIALPGISPVSAQENTVGTSSTSTQKNNVVTHTIDPLLQEKTTCLNPNYYVSMPMGHKGEKVPLLIYLHGGGSKGVKMRKIDHCIPRLRSGIDRLDKGPCIVVVPQCLAKTKDGTRGRWKPEDFNIYLENLMNTLPIDPDRVYLTGNSMGGYGSWAWGGRPRRKGRRLQIPGVLRLDVFQNTQVI